MSENLTSDQLSALQHAVKCRIEWHDKLLVSMCRFFRGDKTELSKAIGLIHAEQRLLENAMATVCRMFEAQFEKGGDTVVGPVITFRQRGRSGKPIAVVTGIDQKTKTITLSSASKAAKKMVRK